MFLKELLAGCYYRLWNGLEFYVEVNDWFDNGKLKDLVWIDSLGQKKHFGFFNEDTSIQAEMIEGFTAIHICVNCGYTTSN